MNRGKMPPISPLFVAVLLIQTAGCSTGGVQATQEAAQAALVDALDAWKAGRSADQMRQESPEVIVADADWKKGRRLLAYEIGDGSFDGKSLRVPVALVIDEPPRAQRKLIVRYIVGTQPVVTLFRDGE